MNFKKLGLILFLLFFLFPVNIIKAQIANVGFVPSNIWYSKDPFFEGDKIKIYTLVFNPDSRELSGTVIFFDDNTLLGTKKFTAPAKTVKDISIDWTVAAGDHIIFAKMENAKFLIGDNKYEEVYVAENETDQSKRTVDKKILVDTTSDTIKETIKKVNPIETINDFVKEETPPVVAKTVDSTINVLEKSRNDLKESVDNKKQEIQKEINVLEKNENIENTDSKITDKKKEVEKVTKTDKKNSNTNNSKIIKPFKYIELFLLSLVAFILANKIIFYGVILLVAFLIIRFLWRLIF